MPRKMRQRAVITLADNADGTVRVNCRFSLGVIPQRPMTPAETLAMRVLRFINIEEPGGKDDEQHGSD